MRRSLALIALLALVCVGCGVRPSAAIGGDPAPTGPVYGVTLFFVRNGQLVPSLRATTTQATPIEAVTALAGGPDSAERQQGLGTDLPVNLAPVDVTADSSGTRLDVGVDPNSLSTTAVAELVCTAQSAIADSGSTTSVGLALFVIAGAGQTIDAQGCRQPG